MKLYLFAGIPVRDFQSAVGWYEKLFGGPPAFVATETEVVWELADSRYVYIEQVPERAGYAMNTILVPDLDERIAKISERGIEPSKRETYENNVTKITYTDADGNEFGFGAMPPDEA